LYVGAVLSLLTKRRKTPGFTSGWVVGSQVKFFARLRIYLIFAACHFNISPHLRILKYLMPHKLMEFGLTGLGDGG